LLKGDLRQAIGSLWFGLPGFCALREAGMAANSFRSMGAFMVFHSRHLKKLDWIGVNWTKLNQIGLEINKKMAQKIYQYLPTNKNRVS